MALRLALLAALLAICQAFQLGMAAQRLAQPTVSSALAVGAERVVSVQMNAHHEGPPQALELDPIWLGVQTIFWGALMLKMGNII
mmetsp:Transcript_16236/g.52907  ORF Transcript_16236/g.52907 Transcript_16236/m.52907 type:complete len:85 (+) Transcript_16236:32-286(+)|eukprot:scaffold18904_cov112-Isochrysis_galbana.AAC.2